MKRGRATLVLADDHDDFVATVVRHVERHFEVVKTVSNGQALVDEVARLEPDIVVLDISMPILNGLDAARKLRSTGSPARIVFLTVQADPDYMQAALATGALGYVLKSELASDLLPCLAQALLGRSFVSPALAG